MEETVIVHLRASNPIRRLFKCQDCGARNTDLIQDPETKRLTCADEITCTLVSAIAARDALEEQ